MSLYFSDVNSRLWPSRSAALSGWWRLNSSQTSGSHATWESCHPSPDRFFRTFSYVWKVSSKSRCLFFTQFPSTLKPNSLCIADTRSLFICAFSRWLSQVLLPHSHNWRINHNSPSSPHVTLLFFFEGHLPGVSPNLTAPALSCSPPPFPARSAPDFWTKQGLRAAMITSTAEGSRLKPSAWMSSTTFWDTESRLVSATRRAQPIAAAAPCTSWVSCESWNTLSWCHCGCAPLTTSLCASAGVDGTCWPCIMSENEPIGCAPPVACLFDALKSRWTMGSVVAACFPDESWFMLFSSPKVVTLRFFLM